MTKAPRDRSEPKAKLERVAHELGLHLIDFYGSADPLSRQAETLALVTAFDHLTDRQARARCLAFVTAEVKKSSRN